MSDHSLPFDPDTGPTEVGELNLERLLGQAYRPEMPAPEFVLHIQEQMMATAQQMAPIPTMPLFSRRPLTASRRRLLALAAVAALLAGLAFLLSSMFPEVPNTPAPRLPVAQVEPPPPVPVPEAKKEVERLPLPQVIAESVPVPPEYLTASPRLPAFLSFPLSVGETVQTGPRERYRFTLPDGSVLYLNQKTTVKLEAQRRLKLVAGEVYVEVAPANPSERFVVQTAQRELTALGTRFVVRTAPAGTDVAVTQGKVQVSGFQGVLSAGQQLPAAGRQALPTPRPSHLLDWTRELMCAAEAPLVPPSRYAGGALVAVDSATGQQANLSLRKYHIDVHIEDGFARTTIDQTYFNADMRRLEGTFHFPLPPDASLSRLAMYVDGKLMEGGMAERDYARQTFDSIVRRMRDPALLEWVDGRTFKMRIFPLEPRQEKP